MNNNNTKTFNHSNIHEEHIQTKLLDNKEFPPIRYIDNEKEILKQSIKYQFCPNCESNNIIRNGKTPKGTQKYKCKNCDHQFVASLDSIFKRSIRSELYLKEFSKPIHKGYDGDFYFLDYYLNTNQAKIAINYKLTHHFDGMIKNQQDFETFLYLVIHDAYLVMKAKNESKWF